MTREEMKQIFHRPTDERALLSFCFKDINYFYTLAQKLTQEDFLSLDNSLIYTIFSSLSHKNIQKFDLPLIVNAAQEGQVLENIGGMDYLHSISDMPVSEENFEIYLKNVLEASTKLKLYGMLKERARLIEDNAKEGVDSIDLIGKLENDILDLSTESKAIKEPQNMSDGLRELIEGRKDNAVDRIGISTGHPILDKQIDGLVPGTLTVVAARPKMGKSTFLSNIAAYVAYQEQIPVLYIDTEMTFDQWRDRIIACMSGVEERDIKHGGYDDGTYNKIIEKCVRIAENGKLFHEFMPGFSIEKIVALYKKYKIKHNIGLMVFDYLKEPDPSSVERQRKEYQILGDVTTRLKDLAGELGIPALTAVQLNRDKDIADSDRIARYADVICLWSKKTKEEIEQGGDRAGSHKLVIRETRRGGATGSEGIGYYFFKKTLYIQEVDNADQLIPFGDRVINYGDASESS